MGPAMTDSIPRRYPGIFDRTELSAGDLGGRRPAPLLMHRLPRNRAGSELLAEHAS